MKIIRQLFFRTIMLCAAALTLPVAAQAQDYAYTVNDDNTITITGYTGNNTVVAIPGTIDGLLVTSIGDCAFADSAVTRVTIPNSVYYIGESAFGSCGSLVSVTIPDSVSSIGHAAFGSCVSLVNVTIGNSVTNIAYEAFQDCESLASVTIGTNVTSIGDSAFQSCYSLTTVTIPASVTNIGSAVFDDCTRLSAITVAALNPAYNSLDGVLFDKSKATLIQYPAGKAGKNYSIPSSVTNIGSFAFNMNSNLTSVTIPNSVTSMGDWAFSYSGLTNVTIPNSITNIQYGTFAFCPSLTGITIGTNVTSIGSYAFNHCPGLTSITIPASVTSIGDGAFSICANLASVTFLGNAPAAGAGVFNNSPPTIYYYPGTTGWTNLWQGCPTVMVTTFGVSPMDGIVFKGPVGGTFTPLGDPVTFKKPVQSYSLTNTGASPVSWSLINTSAWFNASVTSGTLNPGQAVTVVLNVTAAANSLPSGDYGCSLVFTNLTGQYAQIRHCSLIVGSFPFNYSINNDGTVNIAKYTGTGGAVVIPDTIEGLPVTSIEDFAFAPWIHASQVTSVTIPDSVISIGSGAFMVCENLTSVIFLGNAPSVGSDLFYNSSPTIYYYPGKTGWSNPWQGRPAVVVSPLKISPEDGWGWEFRGPVGGPFTPVSRGFTLTNTGAYPESWSLINTSAWFNASVTNGTLNPGDPATVVQLSVNPAASSLAMGNYNITLWFTNLTEQYAQSCPITLIVGPYTYLVNFTLGGGFYIAGITISGYTGTGGDVVIPDTIQCLPVTCILSGFDNNSSLTSVRIPDSVEYLYAAFSNCSNLTSVTMGSNVSYLITGMGGEGMFARCPKLNKVVFRGNAPWCQHDFLTGLPMVFTTSHATIYYKLGTTGWSNPWETRPTVAVSSSDIHIKITGPLKTAGVAGNPPLVISGTVNDPVPISQVLIGLDGGPVTNVATLTERSGNTTSWSYTWTPPPAPGNHTVCVKAVDDLDLESLKTNTFFYQVFVPLTLVTNTDGIVSSAGGKLSPTVSSFGTPTNGAPLVVGKTYTLTAAPALNTIFSNWVAVANGVTTFITNTAKCSFTMQTNLVLTANFVSNRFTTAAGTYYGLFSETNEVTPQSAGFLKLTTTSKAGKPGGYSGSLTLAGKTVGFTGSFDLAGNAAIPLAFGFATVTLQLHLAADGSDTVTGSVSNNDGSWSAVLEANRAVFKAGNPATAYAGQYTMVIPGSTNATAAPGGDGYGTVTVAASGTISLVGNLGDGAVLSQSVPVSKHGDWPFYCPCSTATGTNAAVIMGWLSFSNGLSGTVSWIKSPVSGDAYYPQGFTNQTDILASRYGKPAVNNRALNLNGGTGSVLQYGGNLDGTLSNNVTLSTHNIFTTSTNYGLNLKVTTATGKLTGMFTNAASGNVVTPLAGVVLQEQNIGRGFFKGTNQTGAFLLEGN